MKKLFKVIADIAQRYKSYRMIMTSNHIEIKFSPKKNNEDEVNFVEWDNVLINKEARDLLIFHLESHLQTLESTNSWHN